VVHARQTEEPPLESANQKMIYMFPTPSHWQLANETCPKNRDHVSRLMFSPYTTSWPPFVSQPPIQIAPRGCCSCSRAPIRCEFSIAGPVRRWPMSSTRGRQRHTTQIRLLQYSRRHLATRSIGAARIMSSTDRSLHQCVELPWHHSTRRSGT